MKLLRLIPHKHKWLDTTTKQGRELGITHLYCKRCDKHIHTIKKISLQTAVNQIGMLGNHRCCIDYQHDERRVI